MEIQKFEIEGPLLIKLRSFQDNRGFFVERFNSAKFGDNGLPTNFIQDNFSRSQPNVLRGLHFQMNPPQGKLVSCTTGEIFDVAVDVRPNSPTYGKHISVTLNGDTPSWLWIPAGFAHGFCVTSKTPADVLYKVDAPYSPGTEKSLLWSSNVLGINWPIKNPILSDKDKIAPEFKF